MLRIVPYAALHFGAYEHYRQVLVKAAASMSNSSVSDYVVPPALDLVAGSAAGATAVMVSSPDPPAMHSRFLQISGSLACCRSACLVPLKFRAVRGSGMHPPHQPMHV